MTWQEKSEGERVEIVAMVPVSLVWAIGLLLMLGGAFTHEQIAGRVGLHVGIGGVAVIAYWTVALRGAQSMHSLSSRSLALIALATGIGLAMWALAASVYSGVAAITPLLMYGPAIVAGACRIKRLAACWNRCPEAT